MNEKRENVGGFFENNATSVDASKTRLIQEDLSSFFYDVRNQNSEIKLKVRILAHRKAIQTLAWRKAR